jgi:hypothetical protein
MPEQYTITGTIIPPEGVDRAGIRVQAFDRDLPSLERRQGSTPQLLGETIVDAEGRFQITYTLEQFQTGEGIPLFRRMRSKNADLSFRVFDRSGQELSIKSIEAMDRGFGPDQIIFNAPPELEVSIIVESTQQAGDSEYEKLLALISPIIEGVPLTELTNEDVSFMLNELDADQHLETKQKIEWLRRSALLTQETRLLTEVFYGWGRVGLVDAFATLAVIPFEKLPSVLEKLTDLSEDELRQGLLKAIGEDIIPAILRERVDEIARQLKRRGQVLRTVKAQLLDEETKAILAGYTVTTFDEDAGDENRGLDITDNRGWFVFDFSVPRDEPERLPKRKFRLEVQTPEGDKLPEDGYISVDLTKPETDIVPAFIKIPKPELAAQQEAFKSVFTKRTSALQKYLIDKQKIHTFADIRRKGGLSHLPDLPKKDSAFITKLESLADLDRISPDVSINLALFDNNFDSVLAIADTPRSEFVSKVSNENIHLTELDATRLHVMATVQTNLLNNILMGMAADVANGFKLPTSTGEEQ